MEQQDSTPNADKRHRSPNFPAFSLAKAIERAGILYQHERTSPVSPAIACEHWAVKVTSSSGLRYLSAMRSFGLIEDAGGGRVKLSERGQVLVRHPDKDSPEYVSALRAAALAPRIHAEVWAKYESDGLPSDKNLAWELESAWKFHPSAIDGLIAEIKDTFALAGLVGGAKMPTPPRPDDREAQNARPAADSKPAPTPMPTTTPANKLDTGTPHDLPLPLMSGGVAILRLPHRLSKDDFEWLKTMLDKLKGGILDQSEDARPQD